MLCLQKNLLLLVLMWLCMWSNAIQAQTAPKLQTHFTSRVEQIKVLPKEKGYTSQVSYRGWLPKKKKRTFKVYYDEMRQVSDIEAFWWAEGVKKEKASKKDILHRPGERSKLYDIEGFWKFTVGSMPDTFQFQYNYTVTCPELMYLSLLPMNDIQQVDTILYTIEVPEDYQLHFKVSGSQSQLEYLSIDSSMEGDGTLYTFEAAPLQPLYPADPVNQLFSTTKPPAIRLIVTPAEGGKKLATYFNEWYHSKATSYSSLDPATIESFDELLSAAKKGEDSLRLLFDYLKSEIGNANFRQGLDAVQFRDLNVVYQKKEGDSKDKTNLLCHLLRYYGYEAYPALAASLEHPYPLDFPSMASVDHAVAAVKRPGGKWYYMDATDPHCNYDRPSRRVQGCQVMLIDGEVGKVQKVPVVGGERNLIDHTLDLKKVDSTRLQGEYFFEYFGDSYSAMADRQHLLDDRQFNLWLSEQFATYSSKIVYDNYALEEKDSSLLIDGRLYVKNVIMEINGQNLLFLSFLPFPHNFPFQLKPGQDLVLHQTTHNTVEVKIQLHEPFQVQLPKKVVYDAPGFHFDFAITHPSPSELRVNYTFHCDHILITGGLVEEFNKVNRVMENAFQGRVEMK